MALSTGIRPLLRVLIFCLVTFGMLATATFSPPSTPDTSSPTAHPLPGTSAPTGSATDSLSPSTTSAPTDNGTETPSPSPSNGNETLVPSMRPSASSGNQPSSFPSTSTPASVYTPTTSLSSTLPPTPVTAAPTQSPTFVGATYAPFSTLASPTSTYAPSLATNQTISPSTTAPSALAPSAWTPTSAANDTSVPSSRPTLQPTPSFVTPSFTPALPTRAPSQPSINTPSSSAPVTASPTSPANGSAVPSARPTPQPSQPSPPPALYQPTQAPSTRTPSRSPTSVSPTNSQSPASVPSTRTPTSAANDTSVPSSRPTLQPTPSFVTPSFTPALPTRAPSQPSINTPSSSAPVTASPTSPANGSAVPSARPTLQPAPSFVTPSYPSAWPTGAPTSPISDTAPPPSSCTTSAAYNNAVDSCLAVDTQAPTMFTSSPTSAFTSMVQACDFLTEMLLNTTARVYQCANALCGSTSMCNALCANNSLLMGLPGVILGGANQFNALIGQFSQTLIQQAVSSNVTCPQLVTCGEICNTSSIAPPTMLSSSPNPTFLAPTALPTNSVSPTFGSNSSVSPTASANNATASPTLTNTSQPTQWPTFSGVTYTPSPPTFWAPTTKPTSTAPTSGSNLTSTPTTSATPTSGSNSSSSPALRTTMLPTQSPAFYGATYSPHPTFSTPTAMPSTSASPTLGSNSTTQNSSSPTSASNTTSSPLTTAKPTAAPFAKPTSLPSQGNSTMSPSTSARPTSLPSQGNSTMSPLTSATPTSGSNSTTPTTAKPTSVTPTSAAPTSAMTSSAAPVTYAPTSPSNTTQPTISPTVKPSNRPSNSSFEPTTRPSMRPSISPTKIPSSPAPTNANTTAPSLPTNRPSSAPLTSVPSRSPSTSPSTSPLSTQSSFSVGGNASDVVFMVVDQVGHMWVTSTHGVTELNGTTQAVLFTQSFVGHQPVFLAVQPGVAVQIWVITLEGALFVLDEFGSIVLTIAVCSSASMSFDHLGFPWIVCYEKGLALNITKLDSASGITLQTFTGLFLPNNGTASYQSPVVIDTLGFMWVGIPLMVLRIDITTGTYISTSTIGNISSLALHNGLVFAACGNSIVRFDTAAVGFSSMVSLFPSVAVWVIVIDGNGLLWLSSGASNFVYGVNGSTGAVIYTITCQLSFTTRSLVVNPTGEIWLIYFASTYVTVIHSHIAAPVTFAPATSSPTLAHATTSVGGNAQDVGSLVIDLQGNTWVTSTNGLHKYNGTTQASLFLVNLGEIPVFVQARPFVASVFIWVIGSQGTLFVIDQFGSIVFTYQACIGATLTFDTIGHAWLVCYIVNSPLSLQKMDATSGQVVFSTSILSANNRTDNYSTPVLVDESGFLWLGVAQFGSLVRFDTTSLVYSSYTGLGSVSSLALYNGTVYAAFNGNSLVRFQVISGFSAPTFFYPGFSILYIVIGGDGLLWLSSGASEFVYGFNGFSGIIVYVIECPINFATRALAIGPNGQIWLSYFGTTSVTLLASAASPITFAPVTQATLSPSASRSPTPPTTSPIATGAPSTSLAPSTTAVPSTTAAPSPLYNYSMDLGGAWQDIGSMFFASSGYLYVTTTGHVNRVDTVARANIYYLFWYAGYYPTFVTTRTSSSAVWIVTNVGLMVNWDGAASIYDFYYYTFIGAILAFDNSLNLWSSSYSAGSSGLRLDRLDPTYGNSLVTFSGMGRPNTGPTIPAPLVFDQFGFIWVAVADMVIYVNALNGAYTSLTGLGALSTIQYSNGFVYVVNATSILKFNTAQGLANLTILDPGLALFTAVVDGNGVIWATSGLFNQVYAINSTSGFLMSTYTTELNFPTRWLAIGPTGAIWVSYIGSTYISTLVGVQAASPTISPSLRPTTPTSGSPTSASPSTARPSSLSPVPAPTCTTSTAYNNAVETCLAMDTPAPTMFTPSPTTAFTSMVQACDFLIEIVLNASVRVYNCANAMCGGVSIMCNALCANNSLVTGLPDGIHQGGANQFNALIGQFSQTLIQQAVSSNVTCPQLVTCGEICGTQTLSPVQAPTVNYSKAPTIPTSNQTLSPTSGICTTPAEYNSAALKCYVLSAAQTLAPTFLTHAPTTYTSALQVCDALAEEVYNISASTYNCAGQYCGEASFCTELCSNNTLFMPVLGQLAGASMLNTVINTYGSYFTGGVYPNFSCPQPITCDELCGLSTFTRLTPVPVPAPTANYSGSLVPTGTCTSSGGYNNAVASCLAQSTQSPSMFTSAPTAMFHSNIQACNFAIEFALNYSVQTYNCANILCGGVSMCNLLCTNNTLNMAYTGIFSQGGADQFNTVLGELSNAFSGVGQVACPQNVTCDEICGVSPITLWTPAPTQAVNYTGSPYASPSSSPGTTNGSSNSSATPTSPTLSLSPSVFPPSTPSPVPYTQSPLQVPSTSLSPVPSNQSAVPTTPSIMSSTPSLVPPTLSPVPRTLSPVPTTASPTSRAPSTSLAPSTSKPTTSSPFYKPTTSPTRSTQLPTRSPTVTCPGGFIAVLNACIAMQPFTTSAGATTLELCGQLRAHADLLLQCTKVVFGCTPSLCASGCTVYQFNASLPAGAASINALEPGLGDCPAQFQMATCAEVCSGTPPPTDPRTFAPVTPRPVPPPVSRSPTTLTPSGAPSLTAVGATTSRPTRSPTPRPTSVAPNATLAIWNVLFSGLEVTFDVPTSMTGVMACSLIMSFPEDACTDLASSLASLAETPPQTVAPNCYRVCSWPTPSKLVISLYGFSTLPVTGVLVLGGPRAITALGGFSLPVAQTLPYGPGSGALLTPTVFLAGPANLGVCSPPALLSAHVGGLANRLTGSVQWFVNGAKVLDSGSVANISPFFSLSTGSLTVAGSQTYMIAVTNWLGATSNSTAFVVEWQNNAVAAVTLSSGAHVTAADGSVTISTTVNLPTACMQAFGVTAATISFTYQWLVFDSQFNVVSFTPGEANGQAFSTVSVIRGALPPGDYTFFLSVSSPVSSAIQGYGSSLVTIPTLKLVALIKGGSALATQSSQPLALDASQSCDPNVFSPTCSLTQGLINGGAPNVVFDWQCTDVLGNVVGLDNHTSAVLVLPANTLSQFDSPYQCFVVLSPSVVSTPPSATVQSAVVTIAVLPPPPCPRVPVVLVSLPSQLPPVSSIVLRAANTSAMQGASLRWSVDAPLGASLAGIQATPVLPLSSSLLFIDSTKMLVSTWYTFTLTATVFCPAGDQVAVNFASLTLLINPGPTGGALVVTPSVGASTDLFTALATGFADNALPLKYAFEQLVSGSLSSGVYAALSDFSLSPLLSTYLAPGSNNTYTTVVVVVVDAIGAKTTRGNVFASVMVTPPVAIASLSSVTDTLTTLSNTGASSDSTVNAIASIAGAVGSSGNTTVAAQAQSLLLSSLASANNATVSSGTATPMQLSVQLSSLLAVLNSASATNNTDASFLSSAGSLVSTLLAQTLKGVSAQVQGANDPLAQSLVPDGLVGASLASLESYLQQALARVSGAIARRSLRVLAAVPDQTTYDTLLGSLTSLMGIVLTGDVSGSPWHLESQPSYTTLMVRTSPTDVGVTLSLLSLPGVASGRAVNITLSSGMLNAVTSVAATVDVLAVSFSSNVREVAGPVDPLVIVSSFVTLDFFATGASTPLAISGLTSPITIAFPLAFAQKPTAQQGVKCGYFDPSALAWSTLGCTLQSIKLPVSASDVSGSVSCACSHTSDFAYWYYTLPTGAPVTSVVPSAYPTSPTSPVCIGLGCSPSATKPPSQGSAPTTKSPAPYVGSQLWHSWGVLAIIVCVCL